MNLLTMVNFVVSCSKAKKGKADANAGKAPLRHFVPPPPQRGEEFSPFRPFRPFGALRIFLLNLLYFCASVKKRN